MPDLQPRKNAEQLLDMYYNDMRAHLLEVAAACDRIERQGGTDAKRLTRLKELTDIIKDDSPDKAERFLNSLSED